MHYALFHVFFNQNYFLNQYIYIYIYENIFSMFHNLCMSMYLTSFDPRYSLLDENNLLLHNGAPLLGLCFGCNSITRSGV